MVRFRIQRIPYLSFVLESTDNDENALIEWSAGVFHLEAMYDKTCDRQFMDGSTTIVFNAADKQLGRSIFWKELIDRGFYRVEYAT